MDLKNFPVVPEREVFDEDWPNCPYLVSDKEYVLTNLNAAVWLLEHAEEIRLALKGKK